MVPVLPLVVCRHRFAMSSTSRYRLGRVPSAHSRHLSGGLMRVNRSLPPRRATCPPVHTNHRRPSIPHFLVIALPRHELVPTSSGRLTRQRVPYSFPAYLSTVWITFGILTQMVVRKMPSGKVLTRVHSNMIRRYLSHYLISPQIGPIIAASD